MRTHSGVLALSVVCALGATACNKGGGSRGKSDAARWMEKPSQGQKNGDVLEFPQLGVKFEKPDTLYVFKDCGEASHAPEGENKWVPILTCASEGEANDDEFAEDATEAIDLTFYVTEKTRPMDERAVSWMENQFKQAGLAVDRISFNENYHKKTGIYAKLQIVDGNGTPTREIVRFMFPREDVVFVAQMAYPYGDTRAVQQDWDYIMWNFDLIDSFAAEGEGEGEGEGEEGGGEE